jgi:hypothetical protein
MNNQLNEVFVPPIGLKPIAKVDGNDIYGSSLLNKTFLKALDKSGRTKAAYSKFEILVESGKLIPCHSTPGLISFIDWKLFQPSNERTVTMGFYDRMSKKVYIMISNNANLFSVVTNDFLAKLTIHELVHMFSDIKKALFVNMFKKELVAYYRELWKLLFSISDIPDKTTEKIARFLFVNIETNKVISNNSILKYNSIMNNELRKFSTLGENEFNKMLTDYMIIAKMFLISTDRFLQSREQYKHILVPMYHAYQRAFSIRNMTTICIQELIFPSEVIAIASEDMRYGNKALKAIARI